MKMISEDDLLAEGSFLVEIVDLSGLDPPKDQICEQCGKCFTSKYTLSCHIKVVHDQLKDFLCQICLKSFPTNYKLTRHLTTHSNSKSFICECGKDFKTRDTFVKHQRTHESGSEPFFCSICFLEFKYRSGFNYHNQMKHHKRPPRLIVPKATVTEFKCEKCEKILPNKNSFLRHRYVHNSRIYYCNQSACLESFKSPYDLKKHQKVHETFYFRCRACPRLFKEQKILDVHMSHHNEKKLAKIRKEDEEKFAAETAEILEIMQIIGKDGFLPLDMSEKEEPKIIIQNVEILPQLEISEQPQITPANLPQKCISVCELCGAGFKQIGALNKHKNRVHEKESYKFICEKCPQRFATIYDLKRHLRSHKQEKLYQCDFCSQSLKTKNSILQHIRTIHLKDRTKMKNLQCEVCGRTYQHKRYLDFHARTHKKDRRYCCLLCNEAFFYSDAVKWHKIRKHGEKPPFSCSVCDKPFIHQKPMETHHKMHTEVLEAVVCPICGITISESRNMKRHLRIHEEKTITCSYCPAKFRERHQLTRHEKSHAMEIEPFEVIEEDPS